MASITTRKRKDGSSCLARVQEIREGTSYHETKTFDRRPAATACIKKREKDLAKPGALEEQNVSDPPLSKAIERYTEETVKDIARTKAQVLRTIATCPVPPSSRRISSSSFSRRPDSRKQLGTTRAISPPFSR